MTERTKLIIKYFLQQKGSEIWKGIKGLPIILGVILLLSIIGIIVFGMAVGIFGI